MGNDDDVYDLLILRFCCTDRVFPRLVYFGYKRFSAFQAG